MACECPVGEEGGGGRGGGRKQKKRWMRVSTNEYNTSELGARRELTRIPPIPLRVDGAGRLIACWTPAVNSKKEQRRAGQNIGASLGRRANAQNCSWGEYI